MLKFTKFKRHFKWAITYLRCKSTSKRLSSIVHIGTYRRCGRFIDRLSFCTKVAMSNSKTKVSSKQYYVANVDIFKNVYSF